MGRIRRRRRHWRFLEAGKRKTFQVLNAEERETFQTEQWRIRSLGKGDWVGEDRVTDREAEHKGRKMETQMRSATVGKLNFSRHWMEGFICLGFTFYRCILIHDRGLKLTI
jgi:hypothetical protein